MLRGSLFKSTFTPEWGAAVLLALLAALLAAPAGLNFVPTPGAYWIVLPLLGLAVLARRMGRANVALFFDYFALLIVTDTGVRALTYIATASAGPLVDAQFAALDRAIGFDWAAYFHFVIDHVQVGAALSFLYFRIGIAAIFFFIWMSLMGNVARLRETFWLLFIASLFTALGGYLFPALGPFAQAEFRSYGYFLPEIERLRAGAELAAPLGSLQGVISFPSFHTTLALALIYAFRGMGVIGGTIAGLNVIILFGVPVFGGHYLTDMFAGAGVMLASLGLVKFYVWLRANAPSAESASPESAATSAGAY